MLDTIVPQPLKNFHTQQHNTLEVFAQLQALLWRGGEHCYYWTPDGPEYVDEKDGATKRRKLTAWRRPERRPRPPTPWCDKNLYFGVHPTDAEGKSWQRASKIPTRKKKDGSTERVPVVAAINSFYADLDAKDYVAEDEWLPFYVAPALEGLTVPQARGALLEAQNTAKEAACLANLPQYKQRAWDHLNAAPLRASAAWDSGGGYQAIWLLADTIAVTEDNRAELRHYQKEWVLRLGGDDSAGDLERVLRVPGSENRKPKRRRTDGTYPEVVFMWAELDRCYTYADFTTLLPTPAQPTRVERQRIHVPGGDSVELGAVPFIPRLLHPAIDYYNTHTDLHEMLLEYGYEDAGDDRMRRPGGSSASIQLYIDNTSSHYSSNDPLYSEKRITPAHVLAVFEGLADRHAVINALTGYERDQLPAFDEAQKWRLLEWAQSKAARDLLREAYGVMRPDGYLRTLEALIVIAAERESWCFVPGVRNVAAACNASHTSAEHHLKWLNGTFWQLWPTDKGVAIDLGLLHGIVDRCPYANVASSGEERTQLPGNVSVGVQFQHDTLADDVFVPVAYRHAMARRRPARAGHLVVTGTGRRRSCVLTVREARHRRAPALQGFSTVLLPSLGYAGRVAAAYILENPGITRAEIAEQSGVSARTLSRTLQIMERMGLVDAAEDVEGAKQYTLAEDVDERIAELLPHMTSYKTGVRRAHLAEQSRAKWLFKQYQAEQAEEKRAALKVKMRTCDEKQVLLKAELLAAGIKPANGWRPPPQWISDDRGIYTPDRDQAEQLLADARTRKQEAKIELTEGDRWRRREYAKVKQQAAEQWDVFSPWLFAKHGSEFVTMDETAVLGEFKVWEVLREAADLHFEGICAGL